MYLEPRVSSSTIHRCDPSKGRSWREWPPRLCRHGTWAPLREAKLAMMRGETGLNRAHPRTEDTA
eukprot:9099886-Pyramimonas_sp.AAC.1